MRDFGPAIDMKAFGNAPPLFPQVARGYQRWKEPSQNSYRAARYWHLRVRRRYRPQRVSCRVRSVDLRVHLKIAVDGLRQLSYHLARFMRLVMPWMNGCRPRMNGSLRQNS